MRADGTITIGGASGGWGDSPGAIPQLLKARPDYLMMDYLAEVTMSLLARAHMKEPDHGYVPDFVAFLAPYLDQLGGTRIVTNAGGINPPACRAALQAACAKKGMSLRIAVVEGDDILPDLEGIAGAGAISTGGDLPGKLVSANAYLGALPIAAALAQGADVVITGRCADSALALGILIAEFGWRHDDYDKLAAGTLVGHVIECGPQATGGIFSDWQDVPGWENIGYPIAECRADGGFTIGKPAGTGGMVTPAVIAEQILYEVGDPAAYILPDVVADFSGIELTQVGADRVRVTGARGRPPTETYKVSATYQDGYRLVGMMAIVGAGAVDKARKTAEALIARGRRLLAEQGLSDFTRVHVEVLGSEASYGSAACRTDTREVLLRILFAHPDRPALDRFGREFSSMGLGGAPGTTAFIGGRAKAVPVIRLHTLFVRKTGLPAPRVQIDDAPAFEVAVPPGQAPAAPRVDDRAMETAPSLGAAALVEVPLGRIAHGRSGDKGNDSNIAVIARRPDLVAVLRREVTAERVADLFSEELEGDVRRFEAPGLHAFNFLLKDVLGGGGMASTRIDPQGKAFAQRLLEMPVRVEKTLLSSLGSGA